MRQKVRIIAGRFRGKKISFPDSVGLRPTPDRVKETLFSWLMLDIQAARCLDAFAGSGALGFEALSRGARDVVLIEESAQVFKSLKETAQLLACDGIHLVHGNALTYLKSNTESFDIIFLDPPFSSSLLETCLSAIHEHRRLNIGGLIYVESDKPLSKFQGQFEILKEKKAGQVYYGLLGLYKVDEQSA